MSYTPDQLGSSNPPCTGKRVVFKNGPIDVVGDLRMPEGPASGTPLPALVIVGPGSSVKEQVGAVYGTRMAEHGYVTLAFDPSYQGESGGQPRDLESPSARIEDVRCAIDHLMTLPSVDEDRVGVLGICAGGGYAVSTAMIEHRIKAVGTVVAVNMGRAFRQAQPGANGVTEALVAIGRQRTAEARGEPELRMPWIPDTIEDAEKQGVDRDTMDAVRFYRTPRGYNDRSSNRLLVTSNALLLGYDAFHLVGELLTQPVQVIVGGRLGTTFSYEDGKTLWERARRREDFFVVDGAGHYEMYDTPEYVDQAVACLVSFFDKHLVAKGSRAGANVVDRS